MRSSAHATNSAAQKSGGARKSERVDMRTSSHGLSPGPKWRPSLSEAQERKRTANVQAENEARNRGDPGAGSLGCRSAVSSPRSDGQLVVHRDHDHGKRGPRVVAQLWKQASERVAAHH